MVPIEKSRDRHVLVAGGAGYIGSHMVRRLLKAGYRPVVFDNLSTGHKELVPAGVPLVRGDLRNPADLAYVFEKYPVSAVMHFAASSLVGESVADPLKYYDNNVRACIHLLKAMHWHSIRRFIFSSTAAVYGAPASVPIREEDPQRPTNPYGRSKLMIENMLRDTAAVNGLFCVCLRYFNAAGADEAMQTGECHEPESHLIPNLLKVAAGKKEGLTLFGDDYDTPDGTCVRDYVHVEDLCEAHLLALEALGTKIKLEVFNLGNGSGHSVKELVRAVEKVTGRPIPVKVGPRRPGDPPRLVASYEKARTVLGWKPQKDLARIIETAWNWEASRKDKK